jgi:hypothetical protein
VAPLVGRGSDCGRWRWRPSQLAGVLKGNKNLKTFILGPFAKHPGLTDATVDTLCSAMASHPALTRFELVRPFGSPPLLVLSVSCCNAFSGFHFAD